MSFRVIEKAEPRRCVQAMTSFACVQTARTHPDKGVCREWGWGTYTITGLS